MFKVTCWLKMLKLNACHWGFQNPFSSWSSFAEPCFSLSIGQFRVFYSSPLLLSIVCSRSLSLDLGFRVFYLFHFRFYIFLYLTVYPTWQVKMPTGMPRHIYLTMLEGLDNECIDCKQTRRKLLYLKKKKYDILIEKRV